jgi:hypothetical protein
VEWAAAWFKAAEGDRDIRWSGPFTKSAAAEDDGVSTTSDGSCGSAIEPCEVRGIDNCVDGCGGEEDPWDPGDDDSGGYDPCYDCFGDEDPGGGGWNPGDSDACDPDAIDGPEACEDYDTPIGEPIADDEVASCHLNDQGPDACDLRDPKPAEWTLIWAEVSKLRQDGICGDIREKATQMLVLIR